MKIGEPDLIHLILILFLTYFCSSDRDCDYERKSCARSRCIHNHSLLATEPSSEVKDYFESEAGQ